MIELERRGDVTVLHMKGGKRLSMGTLFVGEHGEIDTMAWGDRVSFKPEHLAFI